MTAVPEGQLHHLWLVVKDKGYHQEGLDCIADMLLLLLLKLVRLLLRLRIQR